MAQAKTKKKLYKISKYILRDWPIQEKLLQIYTYGLITSPWLKSTVAFLAHHQ